MKIMRPHRGPAADGCVNGAMLLALVFATLLPQYAVAKMPPRAPFAKYPAPDAMTQGLSLPRIVTAEERRYRTLLTEAVTKGYGVVDGGTEHERPGANFGGRYVLVQWGCGSNCMRAALVDGRDGTVLPLPGDPGETTFVVPTGSADMRSLEFRWNSRLLAEPHGSDGLTYMYILEGHRWRFLDKEKIEDPEQ